MVAVLPLSRAPVDVGSPVELRVRFVADDGTGFEPATLRQVLVTDAETGRALFTLGARDITEQGDGRYSVKTPAFSQAMTIRDTWSYRLQPGDPEQTATFDRVVARAVEDDLVVSVERLKRNELLGVDLTLDDGSAYPEETYREAIREATDKLSGLLDLDLKPTVRTERHDLDPRDYQGFGRFQLDHRPLREVLSVSLIHLSGATPLPVEWVVYLNKAASQFNLVPTQGALSQYVLGAGAMLPLFQAGAFRPAAFEVKYLAGYERGELPGAILKAVALTASIDLLNVAGDLIAGAGVANKSVSIGGLSQSIGTTASATNAGYGSRIIQFRKQLDELLPSLRARFHGPKLVVV